MMARQKILLIAFLTSVAIVWISREALIADGAGDVPGSKANKRTDKQREKLWEALSQVLPKKFEAIDSYAENVELTKVVFYSQGQVLKFSITVGKIEQMQVMKVLGRINRITCDIDGSDCNWILWNNGHRELTIDDRVEGAKLTSQP